MSKETLFEHRHIRWKRELLGVVECAIIVFSTYLIFGSDSNAWKVTLAIFLIMSGWHSIIVSKRGEEIGFMPDHVRIWHGLWATIGIVGAIWIFTLLSPAWAIFTNVVLLLIAIPLFKKEEKEREELEHVS